MAVKKVEICANCGLVAKNESKSFRCSRCGCEVSVVIPRDMFLQMVKQGLAKECEHL